MLEFGVFLFSHWFGSKVPSYYNINNFWVKISFNAIFWPWPLKIL